MNTKEDSGKSQKSIRTSKTPLWFLSFCFTISESKV